MHRYAIKLLEDVVFFVVDQLNNGQPALEVTMNKPNRERQKLMREQNILKQVHWKMMVLSTVETSLLVNDLVNDLAVFISA